jgi:hypothetical protein
MRRLLVRSGLRKERRFGWFRESHEAPPDLVIDFGGDELSPESPPLDAVQGEFGCRPASKFKAYCVIIYPPVLS